MNKAEIRKKLEDCNYAESVVLEIAQLPAYTGCINFAGLEKVCDGIEMYEHTPEDMMEWLLMLNTRKEKAAKSKADFSAIHGKNTMKEIVSALVSGECPEPDETLVEQNIDPLKPFPQSFEKHGDVYQVSFRLRPSISPTSDMEFVAHRTFDTGDGSAFGGGSDVFNSIN